MSLALKYFEEVMGKPLDNITPVPVSGWEVVEILWPLNDVFRPFLHRIRSIKYDQKYESAADKAIERYVSLQSAEAWNNLPGEVWRILLERHMQLIAVAIINEKEGNNLTVFPLGLPAHARLGGIMLSLLHGMKLPWPPEDKSRFELPEGGPPSSMRLH